MTQYFAFLRAINVGGHNVKMEELCQILSEAGLTGVESYIASGNFIFNSTEKVTKSLEAALETLLEQKLGYSVAAFIRTGEEIKSIQQFSCFTPEEIQASAALNIAFLHEPLDLSRITMMKRWESDIDSFNYHQREIYWLCKKKQSESTFSNAVIERTLGVRSTLRGFNTIDKIVKKFISA